MRAVFTKHFFSPQPVEIGSPSTPAAMEARSIRYDARRHGSVNDFLRHADFAAFKQHFIGLINEVNAFAHCHANQLTPPVTELRLNAIARDLNKFKDHLFDTEEDFFSNHKSLVYSVGFDAVEQLAHLMRDDRITLQRRMDTLINLAPDTTMCAGGCVTGLHNALGMLKTSGRGIIASARRFKQQLVENVALDHSRNHHRYQPGNEVHFANAYINFSADKFGMAARPDPFARYPEGEMTLELLNGFEQSVRQSLQPILMVHAMADDYVGRIKHAVQTDTSGTVTATTPVAMQDIAPGTAPGTIPAEHIAAAQQRIEALQSTTLDAEYGPISLHDLLIESPDGANYQIVKPPTLVAVRLMDRLKKEKLIDFEPIVLAKKVAGGADLLYLDGLMWLNRDAQHEALDITTLCSVLPVDMLTALSRAGTPDPDKYLAIFCDIAATVSVLSRPEPPPPLPAGWLTNFVSVLSEQSGEQHYRLALCLLNLTLRHDAGGALDALLATGFDANTISPNGWPIMTIAAARGCINVLRTLLHRQADIEAGSASGKSPLMMATRVGQINSVKILLDAGAHVDATTNNGKTSLVIAAKYGDAAIADVLLKAGANVNAASHTGETALHYAAKIGHVSLVQRLIDARAHLDAKGSGNLTALMIAAQGGHTSVLLSLIRAHAPLESRADIDQHTALTLASMNGHIEVVAALLAAGAQVSAKVGSGCTALMLAAVSGNNAIVKALVLADADTECRTVDGGCTALMLAAAGGHQATVTLLVNAGADIDSRCQLGNSALVHAVMKQQHATLTVLLEAGASTESRLTDGNYSALMHSAICNDTESLRLLLGAEACIDDVTSTGQTALTLAAQRDNCAAVEMLAVRGAATECLTVDGLTPLMIMAQQKRMAAVSALLSAGANMDAIAPDGRSAREIVQESFVGQDREFLLSIGAVQDA